MQLSDLNCSISLCMPPPTTFDFISVVDGLFTLLPFEFFFHFFLYMCFTWRVSLLSLGSQKNAFIWRHMPLFSLFQLFPSVFVSYLVLIPCQPFVHCLLPNTFWNPPAIWAFLEGKHRFSLKSHFVLFLICESEVVA